MSMKYVIQWKSKVNGRAGRGTKLFEKDEAQRLVTELNREYPQIDHEILGVSESTQSEEQSSAAGIASDSKPTPLLSTV
jgi:hypothetical protein